MYLFISSKHASNPPPPQQINKQTCCFQPTTWVTWEVCASPELSVCVCVCVHVCVCARACMCVCDLVFLYVAIGGLYFEVWYCKTFSVLWSIDSPQPPNHVQKRTYKHKNFPPMLSVVSSLHRLTMVHTHKHTHTRTHTHTHTAVFLLDCFFYWGGGGLFVTTKLKAGSI